ncbi:unnamed protein product [Sphagnum tenellum]
MKFSVGIGTDVGKKRSQNQDSSASHPDLGLFIVSDGMGGHQGGEIASALAVETISNCIRDIVKKENWEPAQAISEAIRAANLVIYEKSQAEPKLNGMGTTTTALLFKDSRLTIGHVGDSRCYYLRKNAVWQATRDHSLVQEKLRAGLITRSQLKTDRMKNVITRSVGFQPKIDVEIYQMNVLPQDSFLLCSDGLSGLVEEAEIVEITNRDIYESQNLQKAVDDLIAAANANGGSDNITSILVQVTD